MKRLFATLLLLSMTCLNYAQTFITQKGGHSYTLNIPNYMAKTFDLNDVATLEYKNVAKETYLVVIEDDKAELNSVGMIFTSPAEFLEHFVKGYYAVADERKLSEVVTFENNGNLFAQVELTFNDPDGRLFFLITSVESKTHFYKILCWTLREYEDQYKNDFKEMAKSLQD